MNINPEGVDSLVEPLSYDEGVPYDQQLPPQSSPEPLHAQLADRISNTKVYLLSEATGTRPGKRKHEEEGETENADRDPKMDEDSFYRDNAILLRGTPISHLPTTSIFAYATHFDAHPMGLEWVDDTTCVLVFESKTVAQSAYRRLTKSIAEEPSADDVSVTSKPIPIALWPPEDRINKSLGKGEGLKGVIRMRWATHQDVKKKGAKKESEFYKKYGSKVGRTAALDQTSDSAEDDDRLRKRRRGDPLDDMAQKAQLDNELEAFLAEDDDALKDSPTPPSPPSKMRSDYIGKDGRSLLDRTSVMRARPDTLAARIMADLPHRAHSHRDVRLVDHERISERQPSRRARREIDEESGAASRSHQRPKKTQKDLDDELDAFLKERE